MIVLKIASSPKEKLAEIHKKLNAAHYVDLLVRINGKDERIQADWLKDLANELFGKVKI